MNKPLRFEPVLPLFLNEGTVIHTSSQTTVSTNMQPEASEPAAVTLRTARLDLTVGPGGALQVRYGVQAAMRVPGRALGRRMVNARR